MRLTYRLKLTGPNRPEDVLKVDADEEGVGGDDAADACWYLVATEGAGGGAKEAGGSLVLNGRSTHFWSVRRDQRP